MEPGLGGQEKHREHQLRQILDIVAMEPGLGGQEKMGQQMSALEAARSQWSLALSARKKPT